MFFKERPCLEVYTDSRGCPEVHTGDAELKIHVVARATSIIRALGFVIRTMLVTMIHLSGDKQQQVWDDKERIPHYNGAPHNAAEWEERALSKLSGKVQAINNEEDPVQLKSHRRGRTW